MVSLAWDVKPCDDDFTSFWSSRSYLHLFYSRRVIYMVKDHGEVLANLLVIVNKELTAYIFDRTVKRHATL